MVSSGSMDETAAKLIERLGLAAHPEGGYFRETYRAPLTLMGLPHGGPRSALTSIYFMLPAPSFSAFHRVRSDEVWHHYDGDPVELFTIDADGHARSEVLGRDLAKGQRPVHVVTAGTWQAAAPMGSTGALCGCTVAPGFDFADFELPSRSELLTLFPAHSSKIERFTRP